jgi:hypothetical protein
MPVLSSNVDWSARVADAVTDLAWQVEVWAALAFEKAPALALGMAVMVAMLPLTAVGLALRRRSPSSSARPPQTASSGALVGWPADAWIELAGGAVYKIGRRMVRIGRDDDNEIQIGAGSVHRHHAVIHRSEDAEFVIQDLSSAEGNGVVVNGRRVGSAALRHGDTVVLGDAILKFHLAPV